MDRYPGKYLGVVIDNADPRKLTRLRAKVPELLGEEVTGWCQSASPYAGKGVGLAAVPPIGSLVFVEWPAGDLARPPIWSGATWGDGDGVPGADPDVLMIVTPGGHTIELRDKPGKEAVTITAASQAKVTMDGSGVKVEFSGQTLELTAAGISLKATGVIALSAKSITLNDANLVVT